MPGYHYKRKGFYEGGGGGLGIGPGSHSDQGQYGSPDRGGHHANDPNQGFGPSYGAPDSSASSDSDKGDDDKGWFSNLGETVSNVVTPENVMRAILSAAIPGFGIMSTVAPALAGFLGVDPSTPTTSPETDPNRGGQDQRLLANVDIPTVDQTQTISPEISGLTAEQNLELARLIKKGYPADYAEAVVRAI